MLQGHNPCKSPPVQPSNPPPQPPPWPLPPDRFIGDAAAIERICRAPRYAVRSSGKAAAAAVPLLVASLPQRFEVSRQPCFLYVASELIKTFGDEPARDLELGEWEAWCGRSGAVWGAYDCGCSAALFTLHARRAPAAHPATLVAHHPTNPHPLQAACSAA